VPAGSPGRRGHLRRILRARRRRPGRRNVDTSWRAFLHTQAEAILAGDFCHVDTIFLKRLLHVLFVIKVATRHPHPGRDY